MYGALAGPRIIAAGSRGGGGVVFVVFVVAGAPRRSLCVLASTYFLYLPAYLSPYLSDFRSPALLGIAMVFKMLLGDDGCIVLYCSFFVVEHFGDVWFSMVTSPSRVQSCQLCILNMTVVQSVCL